MLSLFKTKPVQVVPTRSAAAPAAVNRMGLDERKAYRQEMLYQSVREAFLSIEVIGSMYKFKVMPIDERHHRFIVMIDVAKSFITDKDHRIKSFSALEKGMRQYTFNRYGILIVGTYWRVSETESQFEMQRRATDSTYVPDASSIDARKLAQQPPVVPDGRTAHFAREQYQAISDEEAQAFMEALRQGLAPPVIRVGDLEYQSDMAPLDGGIMIGGTQYGKL